MILLNYHETRHRTNSRTVAAYHNVDDATRDMHLAREEAKRFRSRCKKRRLAYYAEPCWASNGGNGDIQDAISRLNADIATFRTELLTVDPLAPDDGAIAIYTLEEVIVR